MNKIAQFHKVSFEQFEESWKDSFPGTSDEEIKAIYDGIKLPKRATRGSAGYDFFSPVDFTLNQVRQLRFQQESESLSKKTGY